MLGTIIMLVILALLCVVAGLETVSSARETKKYKGRTKPEDEKEMYL